MTPSHEDCRTDLDLKTPTVCHCRQIPHVSSAPGQAGAADGAAQVGRQSLHSHGLGCGPAGSAILSTRRGHHADYLRAPLPQPRSPSGSPQESLERGPGSQDLAGHTSLPCALDSELLSVGRSCSVHISFPKHRFITQLKQEF